MALPSKRKSFLFANADQVDFNLKVVKIQYPGSQECHRVKFIFEKAYDQSALATAPKSNKAAISREYLVPEKANAMDLNVDMTIRSTMKCRGNGVKAKYESKQAICKVLCIHADRMCTPLGETQLPLHEALNCAVQEHAAGNHCFSGQQLRLNTLFTVPLGETAETFRGTTLTYSLSAAAVDPSPEAPLAFLKALPPVWVAPTASPAADAERGAVPVWDVSGTFYVPQPVGAVPADMTPDPAIHTLFPGETRPTTGLGAGAVAEATAGPAPDMARQLRLVTRVQSWVRGFRARKQLSNGRRLYSSYVQAETARLESLEQNVAATHIQALFRGVYIRVVFGRLLKEAAETQQAHIQQQVRGEIEENEVAVGGNGKEGGPATGVANKHHAVEEAPTQEQTQEPTQKHREQLRSAPVVRVGSELTEEQKAARLQRAQELRWIATNKRTWAILRKPI
jgi:hypothetical protein